MSGRPDCSHSFQISATSVGLLFDGGGPEVDEQRIEMPGAQRSFLTWGGRQRRLGGPLRQDAGHDAFHVAELEGVFDSVLTGNGRAHPEPENHP